jgi:hypothetical protein
MTRAYVCGCVKMLPLDNPICGEKPDPDDD